MVSIYSIDRRKQETYAEFWWREQLGKLLAGRPGTRHRQILRKYVTGLGTDTVIAFVTRDAEASRFIIRGVSLQTPGFNLAIDLQYVL
jgi:hypothetical protein